MAFKICKTASKAALSQEKDQQLPEGLLKLAGPDSQTNRGVPEAWPCVTCHAPQAPPKLFEAKGKEKKKVSDRCCRGHPKDHQTCRKVKCHSKSTSQLKGGARRAAEDIQKAFRNGYLKSVKCHTHTPQCLAAAPQNYCVHSFKNTT